MNIDVELFGNLSSELPRPHSLDLDQPGSVEDVMVSLGLNANAVGLITINGVQSEMGDPVLPNCRLCFFPPMSGG